MNDHADDSVPSERTELPPDTNGPSHRDLMRHAEKSRQGRIVTPAQPDNPVDAEPLRSLTAPPPNSFDQ